MNETPILPKLPLGQAYLTDNDGAVITTDDGEYITVDIEIDIEEVANELSSGYSFEYGSPDEIALRKQILDSIENIEIRLLRLENNHGNIGHNNPPDYLQTKISLDYITSSLDEIKTECKKNSPNVISVAESGIHLNKFKLWVGGKLDLFANEFTKEMAKKFASVVRYSSLEILLYHIINWIKSVVIPS